MEGSRKKRTGMTEPINSKLSIHRLQATPVPERTEQNTSWDGAIRHDRANRGVTSDLFRVL